MSFIATKMDIYVASTDTTCLRASHCLPLMRVTTVKSRRFGQLRTSTGACECVCVCVYYEGKFHPGPNYAGSYSFSALLNRRGFIVATLLHLGADPSLIRGGACVGSLF